MSYSTEQQCDRCEKQNGCADGVIIRKAVETIHCLPYAMHRGGGVIKHQCSPDNGTGYGFKEKNAQPGQ